MILPAIEALLGRTDNAALLLSGKDSIVAGIACKNAGVRIVGAAYMYLVPGLMCITDPLRAVASALGCPFYEVPHYDLARMTRWGVLGYPAAWCAETLTYDAVRNYVRKLTGAEWLVEGVRNQEVRQKYHRDRVERTQGLGGSNHVCQAIYNAPLEWVRAQFRPGGIAHALGIPQPEPIGGVTNKRWQSGMCLEGQHLKWLSDRCQHMPRCFDRLRRAFPFAQAAIERKRHYGEPMRWAIK